MVRQSVIAVLVWCLFLLGTATAECIGEYQMCSSGDCVLIASDCGGCLPGQYMCPSRSQCAYDAADCTGMQGTLFDWTISIEKRLDWLVNQTTIDEKIQQLQNSAPAIARLSVPEYQWLNDDLHGLRRHRATSFPNGCGLGATWDQSILFNVGRAIATEARALHHFFTNNGNRGEDGWWNGIGMTIYGPNVNLVRDPRWGRNQEVFSEDPRLTSGLTEGYVTGMQQWENGKMKAASCCKHYAVYDVESFPTARYFYNAEVDGRNLWETYLPVFESCVTRANVSHIMCSYNAVNGVPSCANKALLTDILRGKWNFSGFVVSDYDAWAQIYETHFPYCENMTCAAAAGINAGCDQEGGGNAAINELSNAIAAGLVDPARVTESFRRLFRVRIQLGMFDPPTLVPFANESFHKISSSKHMQLSLDAAHAVMSLYKNTNQTLPIQTNKKIAVIGPKAGATTWLQGNYAEAPTWGVVSILEGLLNRNDGSICSWDQVGVDYHLDNDTFIQVDGPENCAFACFGDLSCNYFTFVNGLCFLMPTMDNARVTSDVQIRSGARQGLCITQPNVDFTSSTDTPVLASDARECCQLCRASSNCSSFTYDSLLGCFLNPSNITGRYNPFAVSGNSVAKVENVAFAAGCLDGLQCNKQEFSSAVAAATSADAIVLVVGLDQTMESEGNDRTSIYLPQGQYELVTAIRTAAPTTPIIAVFVHGGTFALNNIAYEVDAILDAWYPGQQGGNAVADVIYGLYNPGGKASATYYRGDEDLPVNLAQQDLYFGQGITYRYFNGTPVIPFGHGLSFTNFSYSSMTPSAPTVGPCDDIVVNITVTNTGTLIGDEVVQMYVIQNNASVPVPKIRLGDFTRLRNMLPGESRVATLTLRPEYHSIVKEGANAYDAQRYVESGSITLFIGGGQPQYFSGAMTSTITISGTAHLDSC